MQNDYLTISLKKSMREPALNRLFKKIGKSLGYEDLDCKIEIHGMSITEYTTLDERTIKRFEVGLISRAQAIAILDKIPLDDAEKMSRVIEEEQKIKDKSKSSEEEDKK
jgi:hypothetical protein